MKGNRIIQASLLLLLASCDQGRQEFDEKLFIDSFMGLHPEVKSQSIVVCIPDGNGGFAVRDIEKNAKRVWKLNEKQSKVFQSRFRMVPGVVPVRVRYEDTDVYRLIIAYSGGGKATVLAKDSRKGKTEMSLVGISYPVDDSITKFLREIEYESGGEAKK